MKRGVDTHLTELDRDNRLNQRISFIKDVVAAYYGEEDDVYVKKSRKQEQVHVRHMAMYITEELLKIGWTKIANRFDCDHATVMHAHRKISGFYKVDKAIKSDIQEIKEVFRRRLSIQNDEMSLAEEHYFIDLDNIASLKLGQHKAVILVGFKEDEIEIQRQLFEVDKVREHKNTGMYILDKKESE